MTPKLIVWRSGVETKGSARKACQACRRRKLKCDGEPNGCLRCKRLGHQCVFESEKIRRGRPRSRFLQQYEKILFDVGHPVLLRVTMQGNMMEEFQRLFDKLRIMEDQANITHVSESVVLANVRDSRRMQLPPFPLNKILIYDALAILVEKISALNIGEKVLKKFPLSYAAEDVGVVCKDSLSHYKNPLESIPYDQGVLLINQWFHISMFPTMLNRTLMLENYREKRYDPLLYSVVFGMVLERIGNPVYNQTKRGTPGSVFFEYAMSLLERETPEPSLTKLQGMMLLSSHMTDSFRGKKSITLSALISKMMLDLQIHEQDTDGFDQPLDPVERELRNNIWWVMRASFLWGYFNIGARFSVHCVMQNVKLPVKNANDSVLYSLDLKHGNVMQLKEHAQAIRDFYNLAFLTAIMSDIWVRISPKRTFCLMDLPCFEPDGGEIPTQQYLASLPAQMREAMESIPEDLSLTDTIEIILYLNILSIHSQFPKVDSNLLLFIEVNAITECLSSADIVLDSTKVALSDSQHSALYPLVLFGLNTSVCVYILSAESGARERREAALLKLREIHSLLVCRYLGHTALRLIRTIESFLSRAEKYEIPSLSTSLSGLSNHDDRIIVPVVVPCASLESISLLERKYESGSAEELPTLLVMVVSKSGAAPSATSHFSTLPACANSPGSSLDNLQETIEDILSSCSPYFSDSDLSPNPSDMAPKLAVESILEDSFASFLESPTYSSDTTQTIQTENQMAGDKFDTFEHNAEPSSAPIDSLAFNIFFEKPKPDVVL
ncbi:uncharacterized protein VTP21DRAFT_8058 [Calcarisporiella thermophila]|uniref:uncharacterized protein n=1 Tax=Calcarisporiella thermophila TaxID=911321 RepID=UPI003743EFF0